MIEVDGILMGKFWGLGSLTGGLERQADEQVHRLRWEKDAW